MTDPQIDRPGGARRRADVRPAVRDDPGLRASDRLPSGSRGATAASRAERVREACARVRFTADRSALDPHEVRALAGGMAGAARRCAAGGPRGGSAAAASRAVAHRRTASATASEPRRAAPALSPRPVRRPARTGRVRARSRDVRCGCQRRGPSSPRWRASSPVPASTGSCSPDGTQACSARFTRCSSAPAVSCSTMRCGRRSILPPASGLPV